MFVATWRTSACVVVALLAACSAADPDPGPMTPDLGQGKADAIDQVHDLGGLPLDVPRTAEFTEDLEFHGYRLVVGDGASLRVEITQKGTTRKLDTTLFVYGPAIGGQFGTDAIDFDDDDGWGKQSRITGLELDAGEYLVVVGTHDARGRGPYRLLATCENGDCTEATAACDDAVAQRILDCVDLQIADAASDPGAGPLSGVDALQICTDGEALGPIFDELCLGATPADFCAVGFDTFAQTMGPDCADELAAIVDPG
jgi:hypothetical protein